MERQNIKPEVYDQMMAQQHEEKMKARAARNPQSEFDAIIAQAKAAQSSGTVAPKAMVVPEVHTPAPAPVVEAAPKPAAKSAVKPAKPAKKASTKKVAKKVEVVEEEFIDNDDPYADITLTAEDAYKATAHDDAINPYIVAINEKIMREAEAGKFGTSISCIKPSVNISAITSWYIQKGYEITSTGADERGLYFTLSWVNAKPKEASKPKKELVCESKSLIG